MAISNKVECPECAKISVIEISEPHKFMWGSEKPIELSPTLVVLTCVDCGFRFTDGRAENIEHDAICRHLGRLTSQEIRDIRERRQLSRAELGAFCGREEVSVKRWETGGLIQDELDDSTLRLLAA